MNRFPQSPEKAKLWKLNLGLDIEKSIHGSVCIDHFTEDDFSINNRTTGKFSLKNGAVPILIRNMSNDDTPTLFETAETANFETCCTCCKRCKNNLSETEIMLESMKSDQIKLKFQLERSNIEKNDLERKIIELRKKVKALHDRSYTLEKSNAQLKLTLGEIKTNKVDPKIEKIAKVCSSDNPLNS